MLIQHSGSATHVPATQPLLSAAGVVDTEESTTNVEQQLQQQEENQVTSSSTSASYDSGAITIFFEILFLAFYIYSNLRKYNK